ncbi:MAG TPA: DEAD/DEAH box helicase, partial [Anaerolineales bacterium]|nr:DEAD/DEAH box helicase [Anaerolineales bacterium]
MSEFSSLSLHPELVQAVSDLGYTEPTPIQAALIPTMISGVDVIGQAQTGTGKTAAFALPILHTLQQNGTLSQEGSPVQALVLVPTRELAIQVAKAIHDYGKVFHARVLPVYGGNSYSSQINRLRRGVDIVVGTPGRLLDLMEKRSILDLSGVRTVVLDEADEMLSMGFIEDIEAILKATPETRQTALFSATMPNPIRRLADNYMHNPQSFTIERKQMTVEAIEQRYYLVNESDKLAALTRLFEIEDITSALIFARTRAGTAELAAELNARGFPAELLNGDLNQDARERVMNRFRQNQITVMV